MPLAGGSHIGPYEILSLLGAGGMGEVYRARDSRLNRDVALKVIHPDSADSASLRARFATEARAVAALNHPNIVAIFDIGEEQGVQYTVSELIEGESLRSLLRHGAIPVRKLIDIAVQIADGLAAAHAAQITHRDLKPENIMLATDGRVKILDFGLARQAAPVAVASPGDHATLTIQTKTGTILGTPNYMSPEQARGISADYRSDQFSFGLILYEMATGKKAFDQPSMVETLSAIVREEPAPIAERLPPPLRWAMDRCLAKAPQQRYDSTRDLFHDLRALRDHLSETLSGVSTEAVKAEPLRAPSRRALHLWIEAALVLALAAAVFVAFRLSRSDDISQYRYTPFAMNSDAMPSNPVWSHDGKAIAWNETIDGHRQIFVRYLNSPVPSQLTHQATSVSLAGWSQDSKRILFSARGPDSSAEKTTSALYSIAIVGGEPEYLAALPDFDTNYDLSPDGRTLAVLGRKKGGKYQLWTSSPLGSPFREYAPAPFATTSLYNSHDLAFSPDGKKILLIRTGDSNSEEAWLAPFPSGTPRQVFTGLPPNRFSHHFSWMPDSRHVLIALSHMDPSERTHLWMLDTESNDARQVTNDTDDQYSVAASPDGRQLAYSEYKRDLDIVNVTLKDGVTSRLIATDVSEWMPAWSLRSPKLVYSTNRNGIMEIWLRTGDGQDRPLVTAQNFSDGGTRFFMNPALSPNGETVLFSRKNDLGDTRSWVMPVATGIPQRLNESASDTEHVAGWSPDGTRVIELAVAGGSETLAIVKVGSREKPFILRGNVYSDLPAWSPSGEWITFYDKTGWNLISPDGKTVKPLGKIATSYLMFSRDGKLLYGIRSEGSKRILFSLDIATKAIHDIRDLGIEFAPMSDYSPGIRYTLTPDGESMTYAVATQKSDLWLLEGFRPPGLFARLFR